MGKKQNKKGDMKPCSLLGLILLVYLSGRAARVYADDNSQQKEGNVEFDATFLYMENNHSVDLSRFARGPSASPGTYRTLVYVNNMLLDNRDIEFRNRPDRSVQPCLTGKLIRAIPFNYSKLPSALLAQQKKTEACLDLVHFIPDAQINYDASEQRLDITIPQIYMNNLPRGNTLPEMWDSGIAALMVSYNATAYGSKSPSGAFNSLFAGINSALNVNAWQLRHNGSFYWTEDGQSQYTAQATNLQRDIPSIAGRIVVGQASTSGRIFDTLPFIGVQIASDERMLPDSQRGYAPDIRGIARTNAQVTVRQGGQIIYQTTVTPGAFLINDLYPTGYGGDLQVTVREANGAEESFKVAYAAVEQMLRPGNSRYDITLGKLRSTSVHEYTPLYQATYHYGLANVLSGYGGVQASQNYHALQLGGAMGAPVGAFSFNITQARTLLGRSIAGSNERSGQSYQISYSKNISQTASNITLAAYRFSTSGYMDFMTAMQAREAVAQGYTPGFVWHAKNRLILTGGQGLPNDLGQIYLSGSLQNYWNRDGSEKQYQAGYSNNYKNLFYSLSVNKTYSSLGAPQTSYLLNLSLPLGSNQAPHTPRLRLDVQRDGQGVGIAGTAGADNLFGYTVSATRAQQGIVSNATANVNYQTSMAALASTYSTGQGYHSLSANLRGAFVGHRGGITFSPYTAETYALVEAKGAEGAHVSSYPGVTIDANSYALVPYLNPYQMNEVSIDPKGAARDIELDSTVHKVAPYAGAVVKVEYSTSHGRPLLITAPYQGRPLPFGAEVFDARGGTVGMVGQGGQLYARVAEDQGRLYVNVGNGLRCQVPYQLSPAVRGQSTIQQFRALCQPAAHSAATGSPQGKAATVQAGG